MISWISRHPTYNLLQSITFIVHDVMIPLFLCNASYLVFSRCGSHWHMIMGRLLIRVVCPILVITGAVLSCFSPFGYLFLSYGFSFSTLALDTYYSTTYTTTPWITRLHYMSIVGIGTSISSSLNGCWKLKELCWVTSPLLYFHYYLASHRSLRRHRMASYVLTYSGWMGTVFSITNDHYWIFSDPLPIWIKMVLQQVPLMILLKNFQ